MGTQELIDLEGVVFLRREALSNGWTDRQIQAQVRRGEWFRVRRGAYVSGDLWRSLSAADRYRVLCRAVLRTAHHTAALSHISAAVELGAPVWGRDLSEVHLTRTDGKSGRREGGVVHHRGVLTEDQVIERNGVRITGGTRAAVEVCTILEVEGALVTVNGLLHLGETTAAEFAAMARETESWPHSLTTDIVVRLANPRIESVGESRTAYLCWSQHLPRPEPQFKVRDERGIELHRVDFAWPEHKAFLEFDGREKYFRYRKEGETLEEFLIREKRREELICQLTGWVCIRITWADLGSPLATARRIRAILERQRRPLGA
jgi:very-short-patch-repair endonuclease